jgi:plasmid replication initiation protein
MNTTDLTERDYSRQSHLIVNSKYAMTSNEINMVLVLLTAIDKKDEDFKDYIFTKRELEKKTDKKWDSQQLQKTVDGLFEKPIRIRESEKNWKRFNWFSYFEYTNGIITCRFNKALKPYLLELKERFIVSDIKHLLPMKSTYSKRMYLLLKEYSKIGHRSFNVEKLRKVLQTPKSLNLYSNFRTKVLKRAETDINKFTDLEIKLSEKKRGRKIVEITYTIRKNTTDLKTFIQIIRENYTNKILFHTKDNKPIMCSTKGLLYFANEDTTIDKKESQKLWEYLHENRENLLVFKINIEETKKQFYLSSMQYFQEYIKEHFANLEIIRLKKRNTDDVLILSIFPNGRLYDMSGEYLDDSSVVEIWKTIYTKAKKDELRIFKEE